MTRPPTRVLVCDDSRTFAAALVRTLERGGEIEVVGVTRTAEAAIADLARLSPDLVTMDIELPGMSGLEAVEEIMSARPTPILILSSYVNTDSSVAAAALASGALEAIGKEGLSLSDLDNAAAVAFRRRVKLLGGAHVIRHPRARLNGGTTPAPPAAPPAAPRGSVIGICASTGGPHALATLLSGIPAGFPVPILIVQHIAEGFSEGLARWLNSTVPLAVRLAEDGAHALAGVSLAPDGADLVLGSGGVLRLDRTTPPALHRPSADALLRSIAQHAKSAGVAVVLTGMGRDGADGLGAVREAGGLTIAQDEGTSAVYGMPCEAAKRGAALILPIGKIADALTAIALEPQKSR
jgi:two-component system, chemotaxis family, protein-glutamate methylesterase/glutaminase